MTKTKENVLIMEWGNEGSNSDIHYPKYEFELPDKTELTQHFQDDKVIGEAYNFRKTEEGIKCDLEIEDSYFKIAMEDELCLTAAPKITGTTETRNDKEILADAVVDQVAIIVNHANSSLNENITGERNEGHQED